MKKYYISSILLLFVLLSFEISAEIKKGAWEFVKEDEYCFIQSIPIKTEIPKGKKRGENYILVEGLIPDNSNLINRSIGQIDFRNKFGSFVLAIKRQTELLRDKVARINLKFSDT